MNKVEALTKINQALREHSLVLAPPSGSSAAYSIIDISTRKIIYRKIDLGEMLLTLEIATKTEAAKVCTRQKTILG